MFEITQKEVVATVEKPDKTMRCKNDEVWCYVKRIKGKADLLVITEQIQGNKYEVKHFGWLFDMIYPS